MPKLGEGGKLKGEPAPDCDPGPNTMTLIAECHHAGGFCTQRR